MYNKSATNDGPKNWEYIVIWLLHYMQSSIKLFKGRLWLIKQKTTSKTTGELTISIIQLSENDLTIPTKRPRLSE